MVCHTTPTNEYCDVAQVHATVATAEVRMRAQQKEINLRYYLDDSVSECGVQYTHLFEMLSIFSLSLRVIHSIFYLISFLLLSCVSVGGGTRATCMSFTISRYYSHTKWTFFFLHCEKLGKKSGNSALLC